MCRDQYEHMICRWRQNGGLLLADLIMIAGCMPGSNFLIYGAIVPI